MGDRDPIEAALAVKVHQAEYEVGKANAAPAGAGQIDRILKADAELSKAEQAYDDCLSGRGYKR